MHTYNTFLIPTRTLCGMYILGTHDSVWVPKQSLIKWEGFQASCCTTDTHVYPQLKPQEAKIEFQRQLNKRNISFQFLICEFQFPFLNLCLL